MKLLLAWFVITIMSLCIFVVLHEETHATISKNHGCIDGTITYFAINPYFRCNAYAITTDNSLRQQEYMLHTMNDIYSYNIECLFALIYGLGLVLILKD